MRVIEGEFSQERWDKKKIAIGIIVFAVLIFGAIEAKSMFMDKNAPKSLVEGTSTKNISAASDNSKSSPKINIGEEFQESFEAIKQQVNNLDVSEIASSSPQVQKLIHDLQDLQNLPKNQAKDACFNICKNFQ